MFCMAEGSRFSISVSCLAGHYRKWLEDVSVCGKFLVLHKIKLRENKILQHSHVFRLKTSLHYSC